jgi:hypothetical protein
MRCDFHITSDHFEHFEQRSVDQLGLHSYAMTQLCPVQLKIMPGLHAVQVDTITHDHTRSHTCNHHGWKLLASVGIPGKVVTL